MVEQNQAVLYAYAVVYTLIGARFVDEPRSILGL